LRLDGAPDTKIRGDRHLLSQAVANLLDNALKYAGGGTIAITVARHAGRAVIEVADEGPGIPESDREAVFDRFVRLEPSRSTPGNGLGLSLVRAVARRHDGTVTLSDSNALKSGGDIAPGPPGLRVRIELPAWPAAD
jgi:signal transduction histidine kinase